MLRMWNIQGNVVPGFKKPYQTLLFFRIENAAKFKPAIAALAPRVATAEQVLDFNRRYHNDRTPTATWVNVAFSCAGLKMLRDDAHLFADGPFQDGMLKGSSGLGDPKDPAEPGHPGRWKVTDDTAHLIVIVAADVESDRDAEVETVRGIIEAHGNASKILCDKGSVLKGPTGALEHFGYRDGVSQPGVRGRASQDPADLLTPSSDPNRPDHGKPGQELVWPGEFVFGYPDQARQLHNGPSWMTSAHGSRLAPDWASDGAYLVFRRLRQHVGRFHRHLQQDRGTGTAVAAGARIVGRWPSGAPILKAPSADVAKLAEDNDFDFVAGEMDVCPGKAHIRKVNPRSDRPLDDRLTHRLLRRGITFGSRSPSSPEAPDDDGVERGLLFLAYMTSIKRQFEFVMKDWANEKNFHIADVGADALLNKDWIEPTGGGYYFTPSISALETELSRQA